MNPADRTVAPTGENNRKRTIGSLSFHHVLHAALQVQDSANRPALGARGPNALQTDSKGHAGPPLGQARRETLRGLETDEPEVKQAPLGQTLDPLTCQLAMNQGLSSFVQSNPTIGNAPAALPLREDLQNLVAGLARRAAWGGDRRKGSARIELSEGALAGATLVVHTEQRSVSVELELPPGGSAGGWQQRIARRLEERGFVANVKVG